MTTGLPASEHGVVANGFYWRNTSPETSPPAGSENKAGQVELWTAWNDVVCRPQLWDLLHEHDSSITSAVWFALHSKGCGADNICTPAADSQSRRQRVAVVLHATRDDVRRLARRVRPLSAQALLGTAGRHSVDRVDRLVGHLGSRAASAQLLLHLPAAPRLRRAEERPRLAEAETALGELDAELGRLVAEFDRIHTGSPLLWLVASEYAIAPVDHVTYPNRVLREMGLLGLTTWMARSS